MTDLHIHRTGRNDEVFLKPQTAAGRSWLAAQFGSFAAYGQRLMLDRDDLAAFEQELTQARLTFE
jgi:hypothetical protein